MKAMQLQAISQVTPGSRPLEAVDLPMPEPHGREVLLRVRAYGVCHFELDEIEGLAAPPALIVLAGHEVAGGYAPLRGERCAGPAQGRWQRRSASPRDFLSPGLMPSSMTG